MINLLAAPPEAVCCFSLETSPGHHHNVRGLHLQQGRAPQWRETVHEGVSLFLGARLYFKPNINFIYRIYICNVKNFCSTQDGGQLIYLPLLLVNELNFRVRDLMVGWYSTHFEYSLLVLKSSELMLCYTQRRSTAARFSCPWLCPTRESL